MKRTLMVASMALAAAWLGGCASPEPRYYTLASGGAAQAATAGASSGPSRAAPATAQPV